MKIVFFSHYFTPEGNAPASRTHDHCARWAAAGHDVTVITCAPNVPDGKVYDGYRNRLWPTRDVIDGVNIVRVWTFLRANPGKVTLILNYLTYFFSALLAFVFFVRRPRIVIATSPQFFCGVAGVIASWLKWCPMILEIRDIWPESILTVGAMKRTFAIKLLERVERWMYRSASHVVTVGTGYRDNITSKVDIGDRISVVTNGVDPEQFVPRDRCLDLVEQYELHEKFVCSYVGTVGLAHGLDVVVRAAEVLRSRGRDDILFLVVGGGTKLPDLRRSVEQKGLGGQIIFTGRMNKSQMPNVLATSDACLVHLSKVELFETVIPSKIFETMAMRRPIIMGVKGPAREIVLRAQGGVALEPENDRQLCDRLEEMADDPELVERLGRSARRFVIEHYNRDDLAKRFLQIIQDVADGVPVLDPLPAGSVGPSVAVQEREQVGQAG